MTVEPTSREQAGGLRALGRALAHRNYRLFFAGQGTSLVGTWMTRLATNWLVFRLSGPDAALLLGLVNFAGQVPAFALGPVAGALVDRWNRRRLLILTQALSLVQSALLALVAFRGAPGNATLVGVMLLSLFQGLLNAFDMPARQAFLVEMIERPQDLANAIALNSSLVNGARLVGPSLAGAVIAVAGEGWCFVLDAASYLAVLAALLAMRVAPRPPRRRPPFWRGIAEGFHYAFGFAPIRALLLLLALVSFSGASYRALMPIFAADVLHGGPYAFGFLTGASGVGALAGALYLASRRTVLGLGRVLVVTTVCLGAGLIGFGLSRWLAASLLLMLLVGFGMMVAMAACNTILQTIVDVDKCGRVMSFYSMAFQGAAPFGSLVAGSLAGALGAPDAVLIAGVACLAGAAQSAVKLLRLREGIRPIYVRLGVLPPVTAGIQTAAELSRPPQG
jgi:MFS family permease